MSGPAYALRGQAAREALAKLYADDRKDLPPGTVVRVAVDIFGGEWRCFYHGRVIKNPEKHKYHYFGHYREPA